MRILNKYKGARALPGYVIFLGLAISAGVARAHHSQAAFHDELVTIEGRIESVIWRNPHPAMTLTVRDDSGAEQLLRVQVLANVNGMNRNGVTGDEFRIGDTVSLTGKPSRYRDDLLLALEAELADGTPIRLGPDTTALGSVTYTGSGSRDDTADIGEPSLFRVWTVADRTRNFELPLREEALAIKETWDPLHDDHQRNCEPIGMPGAMMSPHPIQFVEQDENIVLLLEEWDGVRTIHLSAGVPVVTGSRLGHSTGRWEGGDLVVTTTAINYPWLDEYGTPQGEGVQVIERFTLSGDGRYLDWSATISDPENFTGDFEIATTRWEYIPGEVLQDYACEPTDDLLTPQEAAD